MLMWHSIHGIRDRSPLSIFEVTGAFGKYPVVNDDEELPGLLHVRRRAHCPTRMINLIQLAHGMMAGRPLNGSPIFQPFWLLIGAASCSTG
jgi:hypothetical protein